MSVPGYASYRRSGVEWLGEVPSHWQVRRLKHIADAFPSNVDKKSYDDGTLVRLCNYTDVYYNDVIIDDPDFMLATATADQVAKFTLRAGDTIITKDSETAGDIASAAYVPADMPGVVCGYHLSMIRPHPEVSGAFIKRYFDTAFAKASVHVRANGLTRVGLGQYAVDNLDLPVPPLPEQVTIAAFLDREASKIDALVEAQRRLIELLKEKRQAVISHAVTKGLDPTAPMKHSGVEWLGEVPAHWNVLPLKRDLTFLTSGSRGWAEHYADEGALFIRIGNLTRDRVDLDLSDIQRVAVPPGSEGERTRVKPGDVLFSITAFLGSVAVVPEDMEAAFVSQHVALARPACASLLPGWIGYVTLSRVGKTQLEMGGYGGTKVQLALGDVGDLLMTAPPLEEQARILKTLEQQLALFSNLISEAESAVRLLSERRSALISAAVTGKIDVRGLVTEQAEAA